MQDADGEGGKEGKVGGELGESRRSQKKINPCAVCGSTQFASWLRRPFRGLQAWQGSTWTCYESIEQRIYGTGVEESLVEGRLKSRNKEGQFLANPMCEAAIFQYTKLH